MLIYKKDTPYFSVLLDLKRNELNIAQRWSYQFNNSSDDRCLTYSESKNLREKAGRLMMHIWGFPLVMRLGQGSKVPEGHQPGPIKVNYTRNWVSDNSAHWKLNIKKETNPSNSGSCLNWELRELLLTSPLHQPMSGFSLTTCTQRRNPLHLNPLYGANALIYNDELQQDLPQMTSMMAFDFPGMTNKASEIRQKHLDLLSKTLNSMVPGVKFNTTTVLI